MRPVRVLSGALALFAAAAAGSSMARAGSLPAGTGYVQCDTPSGFITDPVSCNGGADSGLVTYAPFAGISGSAYGEGLVDVANVFGVLNYSFEVIGGAVGDVVPVDVDTVLEAVPISIGYVFSEIGVAANTSAGVTICSSLCGVGTGTTAFAGTLSVTALSGAVYTNAIHLEVEAGGGLGNASDFDGGTVSADPHIYIDPSFIDAGNYSILLSPNIGNEIPGASVPEASTWTSMLFGLGGVGMIAWRRAEKLRRTAENSCWPGCEKLPT